MSNQDPTRVDNTVMVEQEDEKKQQQQQAEKKAAGFGARATGIAKNIMETVEDAMTQKPAQGSKPDTSGPGSGGGYRRRKHSRRRRKHSRRRRKHSRRKHSRRKHSRRKHSRRKHSRRKHKRSRRRGRRSRAVGHRGGDGHGYEHVDTAQVDSQTHDPKHLASSPSHDSEDYEPAHTGGGGCHRL